jgi:hypothetical protein
MYNESICRTLFKLNFTIYIMHRSILTIYFMYLSDLGQRFPRENVSKVNMIAWFIIIMIITIMLI